MAPVVKEQDRYHNRWKNPERPGARSLLPRYERIRAASVVSTSKRSSIETSWMEALQLCNAAAARIVYRGASGLLSGERNAAVAALQNSRLTRPSHTHQHCIPAEASTPSKRDRQAMNTAQRCTLQSRRREQKHYYHNSHAGRHSTVTTVMRSIPTHRYRLCHITPER